MPNRDHAPAHTKPDRRDDPARAGAHAPDPAIIERSPERTEAERDPVRAAKAAAPERAAAHAPEASEAGLDPSPHLRSEAYLSSAMDRFGDAVYRTALSHLRSAADAEDVFQDVFLRLLADATAFTSDDHLKAWLLRVTVNRCRDLARRRARRPRTAADDAQLAEIPDAMPSVHALAFGSAERNAVAEAVDALPDHLREATHLFYGEGCSTDEIARIVGCSPVTVRTRLHRARALLREALKGDPCASPRTDGATTGSSQGRADAARPSQTGSTQAKAPTARAESRASTEPLASASRNPAQHRSPITAPASKPAL